MLRINPASQPSSSERPARVGLAIAGGGPLGAIYELGVLRALEDSLSGINFVDLDAYVGVSAGAFIAAGLANQLPPSQMCRIFVDSAAPEHPFKPDLFLQPAFDEYWQRAKRVPKALVNMLSDVVRNPFRGRLSEHIGHLSEIVPSGVFDNQKLHQFIESVFTVPGRTNDFRQLDRNLVIVAADLDTGASIRFGTPGYEHVPISKAVQASSALPGLYPPVTIDDRQYVDGALRRTLHASAALDYGIDLLIGINPLVPYDGTGDESDQPPARLVDGGLPQVLSQTFRSMIQSRMEVGLQKYNAQYPGVDLMIVEPNRHDSRMFFTNVFSYSGRHELCEHAYQSTRTDLLNNAEQLQSVLSGHGIGLRMDRLQDQQRLFTSGLKEDVVTSNPIAQKLHRALNDIDSLLSTR